MRAVLAESTHVVARKTYPMTKLQAQFTCDETPMATATYLPENISATINQGMGPSLRAET
jgi:hypothetical protein